MAAGSLGVGADADTPLGDNEELIQVLAVHAEYVPQSGDLVLGRSREAESEVDNASVGQPVAEDQLTEVPVIGDKNSLLAFRNP